MKINKAFKYRLNPTKVQVLLLSQAGGNTRFVWNYFLDQNINRHAMSGKFNFRYEMQEQLPLLKEALEFLEEGSHSQSLQMICKQLDTALVDSFKNGKGFPKFKSKSSLDDSFTINQKFKIGKSYIYIPKIGKVPMVKHRAILGKMKSITVSQDGDQWYVSINVIQKVKVKDVQVKPERSVALDRGITKYAVLSDGNEIKNPKVLSKYESQIKKRQRKLSKKEKGSRNRLKAQKNLRKIHRKVRNIRVDFLHKQSSDMIAKYDCLIMEDLAVSNMVKNHKLAKSISDCSWSEFERQLRYKLAWTGKSYVEIDRFFPSSKKCCRCGSKKSDLSLDDRVYVCKSCNLKIDRDLNASINIYNEGMRLLGQAFRIRVPTDCREFTSEDIGALLAGGGGVAPAWHSNLQMEDSEKVSHGTDLGIKISQEATWACPVECHLKIFLTSSLF